MRSNSREFYRNANKKKIKKLTSSVLIKATRFGPQSNTDKESADLLNDFLHLTHIHGRWYADIPVHLIVQLPPARRVVRQRTGKRFVK